MKVSTWKFSFVEDRTREVEHLKRKIGVLVHKHKSLIRGSSESRFCVFGLKHSALEILLLNIILHRDMICTKLYLYICARVCESHSYNNWEKNKIFEVKASCV